MANPAIEKVVDDLISSGRVSRDLRNEYIAQLETGLRDDLLRGSDYTNKTKQLAEEKRQLQQQMESEYSKLQGEKRRLEQWQTQVQGELSKLDQLPEMTATLAAYEQALKDYGVLDRVVVPSMTAKSTPSHTPNAQPHQHTTANAFLTKQDAGAALRDFAGLYGRADVIRARHLKLFGDFLEDDLVGHYLETGEDMEKYWRVKYGVESKEQEIARKKEEEWVAKIREEERARVLQEIALNPSKVVSGPHSFSDRGVSPVLEKFGHARALQHAQNHANDKAATGLDNPLIPERKPELAAQMERVSKASEFYAKHFDVSGNPISQEGDKMFRKHFVSD